MDRETLTTWTEVGPWHTGPTPPNGCLPPLRERYVTTYKLERVDFGYVFPDGTPCGPKLYLDSTTRLQYVLEDGTLRGSLVRMSSEGHEPSILQKLEGLELGL